MITIEIPTGSARQVSITAAVSTAVASGVMTIASELGNEPLFVVSGPYAQMVTSGPPSAELSFLVPALALPPGRYWWWVTLFAGSTPYSSTDLRGILSVTP